MSMGTSMGPNEEPSSLIPVVIAADGSAVVDGEPVPVVGGESVDVAILDTLHGYARSRNEAVRAAISDPDSDYVAIVEVAPDGSSRMLEQQGEAAPAEPGPTTPVAFDKPSAPAGRSLDERDDERDDEGDLEAELERDGGRPGMSLPTPPRLGAPAPVSHTFSSLAPDPDRGAGRPRFPTRGQSDDEYEGPGLLKRPAVIGAVGVVVALAVVVPLIVLGSQGGDTKDQTVGAADAKRKVPTELPTSQPTITSSLAPWPHATPGVSLSPSASTSGSPSPSPSESSASPTPTESKTTVPVATPPAVVAPKRTKAPKPHKETAAEAVIKLAAKAPGRHICYRVYFDQGGWQKPVCDGAVAGKVGTGKKIKAINTATAGTKGTASNAWVRKEHWKAAWNGGGDGVDVYIGSSKAAYPYILGFVINVGDGRICQTAAYNNKWDMLACDKPEGQAPGNFVWGGTQNDDWWLQAVRFAV
ncbi:hypothetical protein ACIO13_24930 [Streptomyces sp. NPDC087425]|uniref:hypothetical protein n=1 Tax=Streptomyces sp. NPDC087425 TaxID=3365787 RepID=UPI0038111BD8